MVNRKKHRRMGVGIVLSAGLLAAAGSASAITVDGNLADLMAAVGSAPYNKGSGTDPMGSADSPTTESNNGFDIKDAYAWYDGANDVLYLGMNFYGTVGDSLDDASTAACERTIPSVNCSLPNDTRTIFDGNETYNLDIYLGTDTLGTNLLQYLLTGVESTDSESTAGTQNPFSLTLAHSVSETNNGVEFSVGGLYASGALPPYGFSNPADLHLVFGAGSIDTNPVSSGAEDTFALQMQVVPVPAAVWLFASGLVGLAGMARRKTGKRS